MLSIFLNRKQFIFIALCLCLLSSATQAQSEATQRLLARNKTFETKVIKVADNVYSAVGYQVSTNSMIVGSNGVIIIDPGMVPSAAAKVRKEFENITDKPVKAIIYTHGHFDHTNGAIAFYEKDKGIQVWQRSNYNSETTRQNTAGLSGGVRPSNTQGFDLPDEQRIGVGIAIPPRRPPRNALMNDGVSGQATPQMGAGVIAPTHTFAEERISLTIAGVELELVKAPGETDDQLYVWLPGQRVLFAGDNFYQSWPNTYPLRGTARRSVRDWIDSLEKMIQEDPLVVVGGHTDPIVDDAKTVLTNYRDALKWVHDKTIEGAKNFLTPDELVEYAALPEHLADLDYLQDYYGSVWGTVRDIYAQDLGWFDGNVLNLHRESPNQQAQRMADLLGGVGNMMSKAREAMKNDDELGAAQLAYHVIQLSPKNAEAMMIMADALAIIAERTFNAPARNYTFSASNRYRKAAEALK